LLSCVWQLWNRHAWQVWEAACPTQTLLLQLAEQAPWQAQASRARKYCWAGPQSWLASAGFWATAAQVGLLGGQVGHVVLEHVPLQQVRPQQSVLTLHVPPVCAHAVHVPPVQRSVALQHWFEEVQLWPVCRQQVLPEQLLPLQHVAWVAQAPPVCVHGVHVPLVQMLEQQSLARRQLTPSPLQLPQTLL
jgi:hypothetical protein